MRTFLQCCVKEVIKKCASLLVNIGKMMTAILRPLKFQDKLFWRQKNYKKLKHFYYKCKQGMRVEYVMSFYLVFFQYNHFYYYFSAQQSTAQQRRRNQQVSTVKYLTSITKRRYCCQQCKKKNTKNKS